MIQNTGYVARDKSIIYGIKQFFKNVQILSIFLGLVPIFKWLPKYSVKHYLVGDVISGITVAVMHIPQGMAYGILAGLTPSVGLYMAFLPCLVYMVLGTSKHISMGTFSVISMMTLKVVDTYAVQDNLDSKFQVACALAIMVGILHVS